MLLHDLIFRRAETDPDNVALVFRDQPTTYRALVGQVTALAAGFRALGLSPGDRIALLLPNCPPFVLGYYAASVIGAVAVPANPLLKAPELAYIYADANVKAVLTVPQLLPLVQVVRNQLPALQQVISILPREESPDVALFDSIVGITSLREVMMQGQQRLAEGAGLPEEASSRDESDCAVIIYTSGTTGHPKGAMLSHKNLTRNVEQVKGVLTIQPEDRFVTVLPLFHSFAATVCMNCALASGSGSVLMENFVPAKMFEALEKQKITIFCGVPAIFQAMLNAWPASSPDLSALRLLVSGGAPLPAPTLQQLEATFNVPVLEGDGPTECSPVTSVNPEQGVRKIGSVGPPLPGVEIAIHDDNDRPLPTGEVGEIVVRGDNVMLGYLNQPEATREAMTNGWYHTGDLGTLDADGYLFIVDRKKDMIISAGLNVYPREVEDVLLQHSGVADVAVIGQPHAVRGEDVVAVVIKKPDVVLAERELIAFCRERLANYKAPRRILFRETLPRGGTGKVVKRLLKKELELEATPEE